IIADATSAYTGTGTTPSYNPRQINGGVIYTLNAPCTAPPTAGTAVASSNIICPNTDFKLSLTGASMGSGLTYQWQSSANGTTGWTNIAGATSSTLNITQTTTTHYSAQVTCSGQTATSAPVQVSTSALPVSGTCTTDKNATPSTTVFTSFANAIASMECGGVNGPVVFNVAPNSGPYNERITVPAIPGTSATNTITFNGNGNTVSGTLSSATDGIVTLDGSKYIRFNNLNFNAASSTAGVGIYLTNGAQFNNFTNNIVTLNNTSTSTSYGIRVQTGANHDNRFEDNTIIGGYYGLYHYGTSAIKLERNE